MYKLVACDLDGTLLNSDHEISYKNKEAIEKMKSKDIPFIIATGRIYPSAAEFAVSLGLDTPIIACNGAVVKDPIKDEILFHYPIEKSIAAKVIDICHKYDIYFHLYTLDTVYGERNERLMLQYNRWKEKSPQASLVKTCILEDVSAIVEDEIIYKFGFYTDEDKVEEALREILGEKALTSCYSLSTLVDVFNAKASKGQALKDVARLYNVDLSHVMALGDNENDIPMLQAAGLGIAMEDARDPVKKAADAIGISHEKSGVAHALKKYLSI